MKEIHSFNMIESLLNLNFNEEHFRRYYNLVTSLGISITIPWILYKVFRAIHLKRRYNNMLNKVVVITGASSGLGEALAHEFYRLGCKVVLCARRRQELQRVADDLAQIKNLTVPTPPPLIMPLDLSDIEALPGHVAKILKHTERIDILINNGGISHRGSILNTKPEVDINIMNVNYFGAITLTKAVLKSMIANKSGHIVFVSSIQGLVALPQRSAYCASKHAMQAFSDSLRAEVAYHNIKVTTVSPGYIRTELSKNALTGSGAAHGEMDETTASGYSPEYVAEEIGRAVVGEEKEVVISNYLPKIAIFLRKYIPTLYFYVMARRARKADPLLTKS